MATDRARVWALVIYPESAPDNWLQVLDDLHVPAFVSPLHDKDINADGTPKKQHYHILLQYEGVKSRAQVQDEVSLPLNGTIPIRIASVRAYARYLTHMDNPEKAQYDSKDVRVFGGADYDSVVQLSQAMRHEALRQMRSFIRDNDSYSFASFYDYCDTDKPEWAAMLDDNSTMCISNYIKSRIYDKREKEKSEVLAKEREIQNVRLRNEKNRLQKMFKAMDPFK